MVKKLICLVMTLAVAVSCFGVSAVATEVTLYSDDFLSVQAMGKFDMDVPANSAVKANSSFPLEVGEVVTIKATYSPFSASVDFGVIAPDGLFYGLNTTTGSFDDAIKVTGNRVKDVVERLKKEGFKKVSQNGSHVKWKKGDKTVTVPNHGPNREIPIGTLRNIWRQAGWI